MKRFWSGISVAACLIISLAQNWSHAAESGKSTTFVGRVDGDAKSLRRIAIVVQDNQFIAYVCSKDAEFNKTYSRWIKGSVENGKLNASAEGVSVQGELNDGRFSGTVAGKDAKALNFRAAAIVRSPVAGLYRATDTVKDSEFVVGWIVDGLHNVVGSCKNKKTGAQQVLQPAKPLPTPPAQQPTPEEAAAQETAADEVLVVQVDQEAEAQVQAQKVKSVAQVPAGKKVPLAKKKK
jgi:hypothetical protein